jgi:aspartyl-tRNA synthetase
MKKKALSVGQENRLNNRWIDLRTPANHAIFRLQAAVQKYFREYFDALGFVEIHSPKITPGVSEGGAQVFRTSYFGRNACLAQSPQLYKQMAVVSDLFRVYEIGPVFRAEDSNTHRHLTEFMGLDFEMSFKEHYHEVLTVIANLFVYVFEQIAAHHKEELSAVNAQYPFEPLLIPKETVVLDFKEAIALLREAGEKTDGVDFTTANEKALGKIVRQKWKSDLFIVDKWPKEARPFYTMPDPDTPGYTNSYDVFLRGEEITSGAQRIHEPELLKQRAQECEIPLSSIQKYVDSFKYGAYPHGGGGIGLERVVMLMLGLDNIRKTSLFPRDPKRLEP